VRDASGFERVSRGCTTKTEHLPLYCLQSPIGPKKRDASGQGTYNMECCTGDYCNNGTFPYLPPVKGVPEEIPNDDVFWSILACAGSVIILVVFLVGFLVCRRRNNKKRLVDARIQQDADTYYASDDLLKRSHACGDSTLRVSVSCNLLEADSNKISCRNTSTSQ